MRNFLPVLLFVLAVGAPVQAAVPVLAYHPRIESETTYEKNELIAFEQDLRLINQLGYVIVPASWLVEWYLGGRNLPEKALVITFDDGSDATLEFLRALERFKEEVGNEQPYLHVTTFVIASPSARHDITGGADMHENWWREVDSSPLMSIENHSWDHNHPGAMTKCEEEPTDRHEFVSIDSYSESTCEIHTASIYIHSVTGRRPELLAYPYGQSSSYLRKEYLTEQIEEHQLAAAFGTYAGAVTIDSPRWNLPRYVHRWHWKTKAQLEELLLMQGLR